MRRGVAGRVVHAGDLGLEYEGAMFLRNVANLSYHDAASCPISLELWAFFSSELSLGSRKPLR